MPNTLSIVYCIKGNEHNIMGLVDIPGVTDDDISLGVDNRVYSNYNYWLKLLELGKTFPQYIIYPPPPIESSQWIIDSKSQFSEKLLTSSVRNAQSRLNFYKIQCRAIKKIANQNGVQCIDLPEEVISENGFLAEDCLKKGDPTHGNAIYGKRVLNRIFETLITNPEYVNFDVNQKKIIHTAIYPTMHSGSNQLVTGKLEMSIR